MTGRLWNVANPALEISEGSTENAFRADVKHSMPN
jgi:hypothetical protein